MSSRPKTATHCYLESEASLCLAKTIMACVKGLVA